ncbi:hypothetical protein CAPTEDRAFT_216014 [Capitella teleta]|uniref:Sulfatase N-terminal domain-containing protein n=1 Tax=Capitella teleta TaxID=283909 RepID=R7TS50_CAPTE|nr:hypothetical protein CAPTEDRAFT_216014 [Capitella teleta]|eukprot:ELT96484.1 hypothetical protein CAPTEDRAFT_216014 [Capitella teleta]
MLPRTIIVYVGLPLTLLWILLANIHDASTETPCQYTRAIMTELLRTLPAKPIPVRPSHVMDGKPKKMNVLFMMMDGFRTEIGAYMHLIQEQPWLNLKVKTPNLDKLAKEGMLFERAFANFGRCSASRSSMFVGRRPDSVNIYDGIPWIRDVLGENVITLPQYFRGNGYRSYGFGKTYCPTRGSDRDKLKSWDVLWTIGPEKHLTSWRAYTKEEREEEPLKDDILLEKVGEIIGNHSQNNSTPFFLFAGFKKPHLPLIVPEEYFDLYPIKEMKRAPNEHRPNNTLDMNPGYHHNEEFFMYEDMKKAKDFYGKDSMAVEENAAVAVRRAYYACVSYIDHLIGEIMKKLEDSRLKNNTIVLFAADHGVHLGENGMWGKDTSFEVSTRVPMLLKIPGVTKPNSRTRHFVEIVDIFPTLVDAAQLPPVPLCPEESRGWGLCTEGVSFLPLLTGKEPKHWKNRVFWQGRWFHDQTRYRAHTVRTDEYRYTEYVPHTNGAVREWPKIPKATELYHKATDPGENNNLWNNASYADVIKDLSQKLHAGWRKQLNTTNDGVTLIESMIVETGSLGGMDVHHDLPSDNFELESGIKVQSISLGRAVYQTMSSVLGPKKNFRNKCHESDQAIKTQIAVASNAYVKTMQI